MSIDYKAKIREALANADGCFEAALVEGLIDRMSESEDHAGSLKDLVQRRLLFARCHIQEALAAIESEMQGDWVWVPKKPSEAHIMSMAIRYDHGLGLAGYYDHDIFGFPNAITHQQKLEGAKVTMRQLYEEATGQGFYRLPEPPT